MKWTERNFPGGPALKTLCSHSRGCRFDPWWELRFHVLCIAAKKKKRQYTILIGVRRYILMIMVCIALMTSDVENLLMHLLVICLPLEKCFFSSSGNFFSIDLCEFFIYLDINPLIWNMLCKYFLPFFYTCDFYGTWIIYIWIKLL